MKRRVGLVTKCAIGVVLSGAAWASAGTLAQAGDLPVKAPAAEAVPYWWFHGEVEAGGRVFLNDPQNGYQTSNAPAGTPGTAGDSLAKYYEYSDIKPGVFGNVKLSAGSRDGLYQFEFGGKNIGYEDQSYYFDFSKAGEHYVNLGWDQTPHVYSTSALTPYVVNGNALTFAAGPQTVSTTAATASRQLGALAQPTDIGIKRDTASVQYRWTPDDAWDIKADLSHMSRTGTQVGSFMSSTTNVGLSRSPIQIQKPVDDTTQNYGLNGEYVGTSPWGQRFTFKTGYTGSQYTDNYAAYTVQMPVTAGASFLNQISTWPSNQANGFNTTLAADLPWKSRYAGTVSYTMMTQNAAFIPASLGNPSYVLPAASLDGGINTLLSNNVITTKITSELTSKLSYRYYDFQNTTPELTLLHFQEQDDAASATRGNATGIAMGYVKQNFGEALNWRPTKEWNLGAAYGYERYDWTRADVDVTNEHSGKIFADWKPMSWLTVRSSGYYGNRRYQNYDYNDFVGNIQWGTTAVNEQYTSTYRQFMLDNRQTWKANFAVDVAVVHNLTLSPTVKYQEANYGVDPTNQQGLQDSRGWSAGIDATYVLNPDTSFMVGYMYEYTTSLLYGINCTLATAGSTDPLCNQLNASGTPTLTNDASAVNTFTAAVRYAVIPDKLDTELRYTASHGVDNMNLFCTTVGTTTCPGGLPGGGQYPEDRTWFQRLDATATYKFDKQQVAQLGWNGDIKAKFHYVWERNAVDNWANDPLTPYTTISNTAVSGLFLGWNNPNYNVQMLMASLVASW
jgi:MtrB/PioB family decaheme-associated outer membrane protein